MEVEVEVEVNAEVDIIIVDVNTKVDSWSNRLRLLTADLHC